MATRKKKTASLEAQADPKAPLDGAALLAAAKPVLVALNKDLLARADASPGVTAALKAKHAEEKKQERTADNYATWRRNFIEQVAAAWFLSVVFVRTLEDRDLIERKRVAGDGALDSQKSFFALAPSLSERDYLLTVFRELSHLPAAADLFDARHNPVWLLAPSAEATQKLLQLFRTPNDVTPAFRFGGDTRFLGDLYQDLSDNVRKRYALLQTPRFVESFILDQTLEPAIERFGLDQATLIDPTCGSGHFLLGAFERLLDHRLTAEPGVDVRQAARKALDAVAGADINPYAVSIARFRLTLSFLERAGYSKLDGAPRLPLHVVVADSLLHNPQKGLEQATGDTEKYQQTLLGEQPGTDVAKWEGALFELEDLKLAREVLGKRYAAVVGNPPYITVKDKVLRDRYRAMYSAAFREYSLAVPFKQRFFQLGRQGANVGMITANSFMKREFGKKVIQEFLPTVNVTSIINTSGAYIPGHGTPTVLLFGTAEAPVDAEVLTVLASRGEPSTPEDPEQGLVWRSIADHFSDVGFENDYVSVTRTLRENLAMHPWSLGGGGATELKALLEQRADMRLSDVAETIGFVCMTRADDIYFTPRDALRRAGIPEANIIENVEGEVVRDWALHAPNTTLFPYDEKLEPSRDIHVLRFLWPYRTNLWLRREPNGNHKEIGLTWWEWSRFQRERFVAPLKITFAEVATHNHFVLDRGGKVFKQTAPIIKLPESATEDDHYALLAYLNSSTACFWMKQVCMNKGGSGIGRGIQDEAWEGRFQFDSSKLGRIPLPPRLMELAPLGRLIERAVAEFEAHLPSRSIGEWATTPSGSLPHDFGAPPRDLFQRLVALQEEIDWSVYELFSLVPQPTQRALEQLRNQLYSAWGDVDTRLDAPFPGELPAGHRPFELRMDPSQTQWFARNGYELPSGRFENAKTPLDKLLETRTNVIGACDEIRVIEQPEYKRRWTLRNVAAEAESAVAEWGLTALETELKAAPIQRGSELALAWMRRDPSRTSDAVTYYFKEGLSWARAALQREAVPYLAALRFTPSGLEKHTAWQHTWDLQRKEDAGEPVGDIPVPPKYDNKDFASPNTWRLRGKLDVPKERFISYPGCESDEDGEPVYGWAGWNHRQRAVALATLYTQRKSEEGWKKDRLQPMLAGLLELLPWLEQWHHEPDEEFDGAIPAVQFREFLDAECAEHGFTHDDLKAWRPEATQRTKKKTASKKKRAKNAAAADDAV